MTDDARALLDRVISASLPKITPADLTTGMAVIRTTIQEDRIVAEKVPAIAMMPEQDDDARALLRCQAYSAYLTRHVLTLIEMIDQGKAPPDMTTVREALVVSIREAKGAAEREGSAG